MSIKKIQGDSIQEAFKKATLLYGDEISIIETKTIKGGLFSKTTTYEVLVSVPEDEVIDDRKTRFQNKIDSKAKKNFDLKIDMSLEEEEFEDVLDFKFKDNYKNTPLLAEGTPETKLKRGIGNPYGKMNSTQPHQKQENNSNSNFIDVSENAKKLLNLLEKDKKRDFKLKSQKRIFRYQLFKQK
jgi:flagellar biosynthesis GTPase FlhF